MNDDCLHCVLGKATAKWLRDHRRASAEDVCQMLGQLVAQTMAGFYQGEPIEVIIMGIRHSENHGKLH